MTDRITAFIVELDAEIRMDDIEPIMNAIRCIKRVQRVVPQVAEWRDDLAHERARIAIATEIYKVLRPKGSDNG